MRAQTKENVAMTEDETQIHHSVHQAAQFAVVWIIFFMAIFA